MKGNSGSWGDLPIEILDEMLTRLADIEDLIRFGGVCRSWRSASVESKKTNKKNCGPWLMLSEPEHPHNFLDEETLMLINMFNQEEEESKNDDNDKDDVPPLRKFSNISTKKTIELYLPEAQGRRCLGSSFGWILTIGLDLNIHLLNPLTYHEITLPPQPTFETQFDCYVEPHHLRKMFLDKFAFSSRPKHQQEECVVMVIYSQYRTLAIARPGDQAWTDVKCPEGWYEDVIFYNNLFYAIYGDDGNLVVCDITTPVPVATDFMSGPSVLTDFCKHYLVEMSGDLHLVVRMYTGEETSDSFIQLTAEFKVYKLNFCQKEWIELQDLGGHALFLGNNSSFAISATNHSGLRSNCIYFTDDYTDLYKYGSCDTGLYDFIEEKVMDSFYSDDLVCSTFCTPLFFVPSLY